MAFNKVNIKANEQSAIRAEIRRVENLLISDPKTSHDKAINRMLNSYLNRLYRGLEPITVDFGIEEKEISAKDAAIYRAGGIVVDERNGKFFVTVDSKTGAIVD